MAVDNAELVRRLEEARNLVNLVWSHNDVSPADDDRLDRASDYLTSTIKDLKTLIDDGR